MVARAGGYCRSDFKGDQGVTQGYPLSPTIFNVVVDALVLHWVSVMVEGVEERDKHGKEGRHHNALFYVDDGMVASSDPRWLQGAFSTFVVLFDRVGLRTNVRNTVGMFCRSFHTAGTQLEVEYGRRMAGEGPSYQEWQKVQMQCNEYGEDMALVLMAGNMRTKHG